MPSPLRPPAALVSAVALSLCAAACSGGSSEATPPLSGDASLSALAPSAGTLSPAFDPATLAYALRLPNGSGPFTLRPSAADPKIRALAVRQDDGALYGLSSGAATAALLAPAVGVTSTLTVRVVAEDATRRDYTIAVTQAAPPPSTDAALAGLTVSAGTLTPAFAAATAAYTVQVPYATASLTVAATAHDARAKGLAVKQDAGAFTAVASGSASGALSVPAAGGAASSTITVRVTAQDGVTTSDYTLTVTRAAAPLPTGFTIYAVGDSTMADYDPAVYPNQRGWGQLFPQFLTGADVTFFNAAKNGRSSKSFYLEGSWEAVRVKLQAGDYVFIQFAHNDEKDGGLEGSGGIGTEPFGAFQTYLRKYVDETRAAGAIPLLIGPVVRRYFSGAVLSAKARHDLTGTGDASIPVTQDLNYLEAMKAVGAAASVPVIDLTTSSGQLVEQFGPIDSKSLLYIADDDTHLQPLGATLFAQLAVQELISKGIMASHLNPAADLIVSPAALDFGNIYLGAKVDKAVSVTGLSLSPDAGNVTVTAPQGFLASATAAGAFSQSFQLAYTGGRLAPTTFYVRFQPASAQTFTGTLTVAPATGATKQVTLTGAGIELPAGGTVSTAVYSLTADATCAATGLATCADETFSGLYAKSYAIPSATATTWTPSQPASTLTQRLSINGDTWPGTEIDIVPSRYAQFAVSPAAGKTWTIDSITLWAGAAGGNNMGYRIQYSKLADFTTAVTLLDSPANTSYAMALQAFAPTVTLNPGETLYLRVFPWLKGASASGKYLCLQTLTVHGSAQ